MTREGVTVVSDLSLEFDAPRVALIGDWSPLFDFLRGRAELSDGTLELLGLSAREAVQRGAVAMVSATFAANPSWTAASYLEKCLLLDGKSRAQARGEAARVLTTLGLGALAPRSLTGLSRVEWLAVGLARASLTSPELVVVQSPFDGLGTTDADWLERVLFEIARQSRLVTSFLDLSGTNRRRVLGHDRAVLMFRGRIVAEGDPEVVLRPGGYLVTVMRHAARFREGLKAAGCSVQVNSPLDDESTSQLLVGSEGPDLSVRIVRVAAENDVPVLELLPIQSQPLAEIPSTA